MCCFNLLSFCYISNRGKKREVIEVGLLIIFIVSCVYSCFGCVFRFFVFSLFFCRIDVLSVKVYE